LNARSELDKVVIVGGSYNAGVWRQSPQPPEANGGSNGQLPEANGQPPEANSPPEANNPEAIFTVFSKKIHIFKYTLF